jgi:tRNA pseudouridine13 synthase
MEVLESGGKFVVDDVAREQSRLDAGELSVTGPMFGVKMLTPVDAAGEREAVLLNESGLRLADFANYANLLSGARRAYVVRTADLKTSAVEGGLRFEFVLPSGTYATVLLREFMKNDVESRSETGQESLSDI